jgi:hypothetical protein
MSTEELNNELRLPARSTFNVNQQAKWRVAFARRVDIRCRSTSQVLIRSSQQGWHSMSTEKPSEESRIPARLSSNVNHGVRCRSAVTSKVDIRCQSNSRVRGIVWLHDSDGRWISNKLHFVASQWLCVPASMIRSPDLGPHTLWVSDRE